MDWVGLDRVTQYGPMDNSGVRSSHSYWRRQATSLRHLALAETARARHKFFKFYGAMQRPVARQSSSSCIFQQRAIRPGEMS